MPENQQPNNNNQNKNPNNKHKIFNFGNIAMLLIAAVFIFGIVYSIRGCSVRPKEISYTEALTVIDTHPENIKDISVTPLNDSSKAESYRITIKYEDDSSEYFYINNSNVYYEFVKDVENLDIKLNYTPGSTFNAWNLILYGSMIAGTIFLIVIISRSIRSASQANNSTMEFTKSRAKLNKMTTTKFRTGRTVTT